MKLAIATCLAERDLPRFSILRYTISKFWPDAEHYIVCENEETFRACYDYPNAIVSTEGSLLELSGLWSNWHRQQILKLHLTATLQSYDWIIWLDADTVLLRPVNEAELFKDNLPYLQWDRIWDQSWIDAVQLVLGIKLKEQPQVLAPFLSPLITKSLLRFIERRNCQDWKTYLTGLSNNKVLWTEYALYFAFVKLVEKEMKAPYYVKGNPNLAASYNLSYQVPFEAVDWFQKWNAGGTFAVVESNTKTEPSVILEKVHEWMLSGMWQEEVLLSGCREHL